MRKRKVSSQIEAQDKNGNQEELLSVEADDAVTESSSRTSEDGDRDPDNFLDSFYDLASPNPGERARSAQVIIHHCLLGPNANAKDGAYAFRRLLKGLCSGRASARQGNASALASFLNTSFRQGNFRDVMPDKDLSPLHFLRNCLLDATDPDSTIGKKKGSEERDCQFGRLFGILAIQRSGILVRSDSEVDAMTTARDFANDLVDLFWSKKWMREPAAHAIVQFLELYWNSKASACENIAKTLVDEVFLPRVLHAGRGDSNKSVDSSIGALEAYSAEQVMIALRLQVRGVAHGHKLPPPLDAPVVSSSTMKILGRALSSTSSVIQPRMHEVWHSLWHYLAVGGQRVKSSTRHNRVLAIGETGAFGEDLSDTVRALVDSVLAKELLRLEDNTSTLKTTHERRSLALQLVRILCGVPCPSTNGDQLQLRLNAELIESIVLRPQIVRSLFVDVLGAGEKTKTPHLLRPFALESLATIEECMRKHENTRLALARALLRAEVRFDSKTKTSTVSDLVGLSDENLSEKRLTDDIPFWDKYITHLRMSICLGAEKAEQSASNTTGYVELLFASTKYFLRVLPDDAPDGSRADIDRMVRNILGFFFVCAFFDCREVSTTPLSVRKDDPSFGGVALEAAVSLGGRREFSLPYHVRTVMSIRFFSLLSELVGRTVADDRRKDTPKDKSFLRILEDVSRAWCMLEAHGCRRLAVEEVDGSVMCSEILSGLRVSVEGISSDTELTQRFANACCALIHVVNLHRLRSGNPSEILADDDPESADDDDEEDLLGMVDDIKELMSSFATAPSTTGNPLQEAFVCCFNLLTSPAFLSNQGGLQKIVREAVKQAWLSSLNLASSLACDGSTLLTTDVVDALLESVGATENTVDKDETSISDSGDDESDNNSMELDSDVFARARDEQTESDSSTSTPGKESSATDDVNNDMEIDATTLQSMLEDPSDASIDESELEHHEGADAALASLIKLQQDTRKAARKARENVETANNVRCLLLIELLFSRHSGWGELFTRESLVDIAVRLIMHRWTVERSLARLEDRTGTKHGVGGKRSLLEKLTALIKARLGKMKPSTMPSNTDQMKESTTGHISKMVSLLEKRSASKDHIDCCIIGIILCLRSLADVEDAIDVSEPVALAVEEWSSKKTSRIPVKIFEDFISRIPALSQVVLTRRLTAASVGARSTFLKSECFRLLTLLWTNGACPTGSPMEQRAYEELKFCAGNFVVASAQALQEDEMRKAKRAKVVLKAVEKFLSFANSNAVSVRTSDVDALYTAIRTVSNSESQGVSSHCAKLSEQVETLRKTSIKEDPVSPEESSVPTKKRQKKKKKKKK